MSLPFSEEQFLGVFARYNALIWPLQPLAWILAATAVALVVRSADRRRASVAVGALLALFWVLSGAGYHLLSFSTLSPAAYVFGAAFLIEAALLLEEAVRRRRLRFAVPGGWRRSAGAAALGYALVLYPLIGWLSGRPLAQGPYLGVAPCPTMIFTAGLLLWADGPARLRVVAIPLLWGAVGTVAALRLGVLEDLGMTVTAGILAVAYLPLRRTGRGSAARDAAEVSR